MSKTKLTIVFSFILLAGLLFGFSIVRAVAEGPYLGLDYGKYTNLGSQDIRFTVAMIIQVVLGLLGTIALVIILYAGFKWMTAGGNEEGIKSAQKILTAAVIGLVIILTAYSITRFVVGWLSVASNENIYDVRDVI